MFDWFKKKLPLVGSVLFRGALPPRAEELHGLAQAGLEVSPGEDGSGAHWSRKLRHPQWGEALLVALRDAPTPPRELFFHDAGLTEEEAESATQAGSSLTLQLTPAGENVLSGRKVFFRFLSAVMARDGLAVLDHLASRAWSRGALDEELAHDADLDIEGLFCVHAVTGDGAQTVNWLHTHGLAEIGAFDFDILRPSPDVLGPAGQDFLRAMAFAILEKSATLNEASFDICRPDGAVRLMEINEFLRKADPALARETGVGGDEYHRKDRAVLCEPEGGGFLTRWFAPKVRPSKFLARPVPEHVVMSFSNAASDLMALRARNTYGHLRKMNEEFAEFEFPAVVKLGYRVDGGEENDKEHLWFKIHGLRDTEVDAALLNMPFDIKRLKEGDRGMHPVELLSDWVIMTPAGPINPRSSRAVRALRSKKDELRAAMKEYKEQEQAGEK